MTTSRAIYCLMSKSSSVTSGIELLSMPSMRANTHGYIAETLPKRQYSTVNACLSSSSFTSQQPAVHSSTTFRYQTIVSKLFQAEQICRIHLVYRNCGVISSITRILWMCVCEFLCLCIPLTRHLSLAIIIC